MKRKILTIAQRKNAWRVAWRYVARSMHRTDPEQGTRGMTSKRALAVGRRLGRRIFARLDRSNYLWIDRRISLIYQGRCAGKIAIFDLHFSGWSTRQLETGWRIFLRVIAPRDKPYSFEEIPFEQDFESHKKAIAWALSNEGNLAFRRPLNLALRRLFA